MFTNGSIIGNQSSDVCTQQVGETEMFQPSTVFGIDRTNGLAVIII